MQIAPFFAIARHRINIDGEGVVTLVCFGGCPLRCQYCINPRCFDGGNNWKTLTVEQLYEQTKVDDLYFVATGGGITFGGGEPVLRSDFIREFRTYCGDLWKLSVETSLNVPKQHVVELIPVIDHWIVDVKDLNPAVYKAYTGKDNNLVLENLKMLAENGLAPKITIRLPLIPNFNSEENRQSSMKQLRQMGFEQFDLLEYIIKNQSYEQQR